MVEIIKQDEVLLEKLHEFFETKDNYTVLVDIINKKSHISLRIIDWFVTNYSKTNNIVYEKDGNLFHVHQEYKNKLKGLNKYKFDSCRRKYRKNKRIIPFDFFCTKSTYVYTTIGQLNFFKWAISMGVIEYISENYSTLNGILNNKKITVPTTVPTTRLSIRASESIVTHKGTSMTKMTVKFD